ncbi:MAG: thiolase family protein [Betaproteobacteria bacterium]|nr:thiolase family protein [Betaproteobacteria bacterium]
MPEALIIDALRTPFGKRQGALRETRPDSLLAHTLQGLAQRTGLDPGLIDDVICGTVTQAGEQGANIGRLGVLLAGFPVEVPAVSLNRMCGSSQQAVHFAAQAVTAGDARCVLACGVESMSRVPMLSDITPGKEFTGFQVLNPALFARHELVHQGESAERIADRWGLRREEVDAFAIASHRRAAVARTAQLNREILPTPGVDAAGQAITLSHDEGVREQVDPAKLASLATPFRAPGQGIVTAGNASQISDGASAVLVAEAEFARAQGWRPRARFRARVVVGGDPTLQLMAVVPATQRALQRAGVTIKDIDWFEVNEAFATVVIAWQRELDADPARLNPWGGAIAHGHPLGATGAALMAKMLTGLEATGGSLGLQVMCIGHGMATATVVERV